MKRVGRGKRKNRGALLRADHLLGDCLCPSKLPHLVLPHLPSSVVVRELAVEVDLLLVLPQALSVHIHLPTAWEGAAVVGFALLPKELLLPLRRQTGQRRPDLACDCISLVHTFYFILFVQTRPWNTPHEFRLHRVLRSIHLCWHTSRRECDIHIYEFLFTEKLKKWIIIHQLLHRRLVLPNHLHQPRHSVVGPHHHWYRHAGLRYEGG